MPKLISADITQLPIAQLNKNTKTDKYPITQSPISQLPIYNFELPVRHLSWTHNLGAHGDSPRVHDKYSNKTMSKISIRFYKDRKVRAVWDEDQNHWWFSVLDVVGAVNEQDDHEKNRNYWKYLKAKLRKEQKLELLATILELPTTIL